MADKRQVKKSIKQLQRVKTWQLVILLIISLVITATFLRLNNIGMVERRTAVLESDKTTSIVRTQERLYDLQRYTTSHMNANTGPFYLEQQYRRDVRKISQANNSEATTEKDRKQADAVCKARYPGGWSLAYVYCFTEQLSNAVKARGGSYQQLTLPTPDLYRHEFTSPLWSPDFAGFSLLVSVFITVVIILRLLGLLLLRMLLRRHYKEI